MHRRAIRAASGLMVSRLLRAGCVVALLGAGSIVVGTALAADVGYGATLGVGTSDNIRRTGTSPDSDSIGQVGVNFSVYEETRRLQADAGGDFSWLDYFDDSFKDEVVGSFLGNATLGIVPERFEWLFSDSFGQSTIQPFAVVTPENRENVNYFTTGPALTFGLGASNRFKLNAHYSKVTYEDTPLDSDRIGGELSLLHDLSGSSSISVNADAEQIDFDDNTLNTDFDKAEAYLGFAGTGARTQLSVDLGYTQVKPDGGKTNSGVLVRMNISRRISQSSTFGVLLGREISDAGDIFRQLQNLQSTQASTQAVQLSNDPFTSQYGTLSWNFARNRTGFGLSLSRFEEDYDSQTSLNRTRTVIGADAHRQLTPNLDFRVSATQNRERYDANSTQDFDELYATATLAWAFGRHFSLNLQYERFDRSSDLAGGDYVENRGWIRLLYSAGTTHERSGTLPMNTGSYR